MSSREEEEEEETSNSRRCEIPENKWSSVSEIEEEENNENNQMDSIEEGEESVYSFEIQSRGSEECVYIGVGKSETSMDALTWTLKNLINGDQSTLVYLIHIYPEIHHIPSPLGKLPKSQVSPEQVENYLAQERCKRRQLLQKFINVCSASMIKVETILIESDMVSKAIVDLIPILNIKKLVLGTTKAGLRKIKARKGSGIGYILENALEFCEIKIICEGKEVSHKMSAPPSPAPSPLPQDDADNANSMQLQNQHNNTKDSFSCMCFKSSRVM